MLCVVKLVVSGQVVSLVPVIFDQEGHKVCNLFWLWACHGFNCLFALLLLLQLTSFLFCPIDVHLLALSVKFLRILNSQFSLKSYITQSYYGFKSVCLPEVTRVVLLLGCPFIRL